MKMSQQSEIERLRMIAQDFMAANPGMHRVTVGVLSLDRSGHESISAYPLGCDCGPVRHWECNAGCKAKGRAKGD
jgi:hypothetical protein